MTDEERMQCIDAEMARLRLFVIGLRQVLHTMESQEMDLQRQKEVLVEKQYKLEQDMELLITPAFLELERERNNNPLQWRSAGKLRFKGVYRSIGGDWLGEVVGGGVYEGGIPLEMIQSMRAAYLAAQENMP